MGTKAKISGLGRPLDFSYKTNVWIVILSGLGIAAGFIFRLLSRDPLGTAVLFGLGTGGACFLGWALARELDPDHSSSAFPAALAAVAAVFVFGLPGFLQLFLFLMLFRGMSGITGSEMGIGDAVVIFGINVWLMFLGHWFFAAVAGTGFLVTALLSARKWPVIPGIVSFLLIIIPFLLDRDIPVRPVITLPYIIIIMIITLLFGLFLVLLTRIITNTDDGEKPVKPGRVKTAGFFGLISALAAALMYGSEGVIMLFPMWAAFLFVPVVKWGISIFRRPVSEQTEEQY
ncbi:MAG: hypothetical protein ACLFST_14955 [Spirochaetia bacterium]